jgi:large subunit ribosomal protein L15e
LGYKAKQGIIIVRQRVDRGGRQRPKITGGRRPKHFGRRKNLVISYQVVAEQRAAEKYSNCEVLNSYEVGKDGSYYWYEVILVDRAHPAVMADKQLSQAVSRRGRAYRGLTSAAKK